MQYINQVYSTKKSKQKRKTSYLQKKEKLLTEISMIHI